MQTSQSIARLMSPVLSVIGIGMLTNQATYREMAGQFLGRLPAHLFFPKSWRLSSLAILNAHHVSGRATGAA